MRFKTYISVLVIYFEQFETLQVLAFIYQQSNTAKKSHFITRHPVSYSALTSNFMNYNKSLGTPAAINICLNMLGIIRAVPQPC